MAAGPGGAGGGGGGPGGPPPLSSSHKKHIKQHKKHKPVPQNFNRHSSSSGPGLEAETSSDEDGVEDVVDQYGNVVIQTDQSLGSNTANTQISYSNNHAYTGHQSVQSSTSYSSPQSNHTHHTHNNSHTHTHNHSNNQNGYRYDEYNGSSNNNNNNNGNYNNGVYPSNSANNNNGYHQSQQPPPQAYHGPNQHAHSSSGHIPPYQYSNNQGMQPAPQQMHPFNQPAPRGMRGGAQPPPLPKHKMQGYKDVATNNYSQAASAMHSHASYYQPPPQQAVPLQQQPAFPREHALSEANTNEQFATSFEQFDDDDLLGTDADLPDLDNFAPIHYDQRFSIHKADAIQNVQNFNPGNVSKSNYSRSSASDSQQNQSSHHAVPPPPNGPPPAASVKQYRERQLSVDGDDHANNTRHQNKSPQNQIKNKQLSKQKQRSRNNPPSINKNERSFSGGNANANGGMSITITAADTESYVEEKPSTPSRSSKRNDRSETRDSDADDELLQRDKDYRPSIVENLEHTDDVLQVTIDRYGFPMDEDMDEKEHRKQVKKENLRLLKWQDMVFAKKTGGTAAEADNEVDQQINHWNRVKNHRKLKSRIRKGVPQQLRGTIWQNLSGARERRKIECARYGSKNLYNDLRAKKKSHYHDQIWKDINRTYRKNLAYGASHLASANNNAKNTDSNKTGAVIQRSGTQKFFKNVLQDASIIATPSDLEKHATPAQLALYNVLKAFSLYRKDIGYCQGMQAVTALLLMYMTEEEAFWVLASLADDTKYQMDNLWRPHMPAIQLRFYQMERLVKITMPKLSAHFEKQGILSASMYQASQWFITIFLATDMRFGTIVRVWDIYLNEGLKTVFRMGIGFLKYYEKMLLKSDFEEMLQLFRTGAAQIEPEEYIKVCFTTRITHAQLAAFEKDFNRQNKKHK